MGESKYNQRDPLFPVVKILDRARGLAVGPWLRLGAEPLLEDVISDPIIQQIMIADHLKEMDVRRMIARAQGRAARR